MGERSDAVAVGEVDIGAVFDEQGHDGLVRRAAIRQQDRLEQGRPPKPIDVVDVHVRLGQEIANDLDVSPLGRRDQGHAAVAVGDGRIGPGFMGEHQDVEQTFRAGVQERVVELVVLEVHVGPRREQHAERLGLAGFGGDHERSPSGRIASIHVGAAGKGGRDPVQVACRRRDDQSLVHVWTSGRGRGTAPGRCGTNGEHKDHPQGAPGHLRERIGPLRSPP